MEDKEVIISVVFKLEWRWVNQQEVINFQNRQGKPEEKQNCLKRGGFYTLRNTFLLELGKKGSHESFIPGSAGSD